MEQNQQLSTLEYLRTSQVIEAWALIEAGEKIGDACAQVGLTKRQFNYWVQRGQDAIASFRELVVALERQNYLNVVMARAKAIEEMTTRLEDSKTIKTPALIQIETRLAQIQAELEPRIGVNAKGDDEAQDFLGMPEFRQVESRFHPGVTTTVKRDGSVEIKVQGGPQVIDLPPGDPEEPDSP